MNDGNISPEAVSSVAHLRKIDLDFRSTGGISFALPELLGRRLALYSHDEGHNHRSRGEGIGIMFLLYVFAHEPIFGTAADHGPDFS